MQQMSSNSERCPVCGSPKSVWLDDNCPNCLMQLGDTAAPVDLLREQPVMEMMRRVGDYELVEEIARGGMGVVYRARQRSLNRMVAVKLLLGGQFANETFLKRFRHEAEVAGSLHHPNIVSIYEVGEHDGQPYFSMELVNGCNLAELIHDPTKGGLPVRRGAQLLKTIAETVHFAHERGLLHRDLKPSNVMVDDRDIPHITDFGLAKWIALPTSSPGPNELTITGQVLGTPNYMAPEQADPRRGVATAATDIYSLGAVLYHLLTGRPPFLAETVTQTLLSVTETEPVSPRLLNGGIPRDLETICLKCLSKNSKDRYPTAQELADELGRFLNGEPIRARPIGVAGRTVRWCGRKPALAAVLGVALSLLLIVLIGSPIAIMRINTEREHAEAAQKKEAALRLRAEAAERQTEQQLHAALLEQARGTVRSGEVGQRVNTLDAIRRAAAITNSAELRREAFAALGLPDLRFERELPIGLDCTMTALDPKLERLAICKGTNAVEIRSVPDQRLLTTLPATSIAPAIAVKWSGDGRFLIVRRDREYRDTLADILVWEVASARQVLSPPRTKYGACALHPKEPQLLCSDPNESVAIWNLETGQDLNRFAMPGLIRLLEFSADGQTFVVHRVAGDDGFISVHDARSGRLRWSISSGWVDQIAWDPQDRWVALASRSGEIVLCDPANGQSTVLGRHKREVRTAVFSADGQFLFTGGEEQEIACWDLRSKSRAFNISLQSTRAQLSSDGARCAVLSKSGIRLYAFERSLPYREMNGDLGGVLQAVVSPDGHWLAAAGGQRVGLWDLLEESPVVIATEAINAMPLFSPDSSELLAFWNDGFQRWRIDPGHAPRVPLKLTPLPISKPGRIHSAGFASGSLVLGTPVGAFVIPEAEIASGSGEFFRIGVAHGQISPNGAWAVFRKSGERFEDFFRLKPWNGVRFVECDAEIVAEAFTPRSDECAVATSTSVTFLSTNRWNIERRFPAILDRNARLVFSPDAGTVWLTRDARAAGLLDTKTFQPLLPLPAGMTPLALSPDGRWLVLRVEARRLQLWDLTAIHEHFRELGIDWR